MTLYVHRLIDALNGVRGADIVRTKIGPELRRNLISALKAAEKFDFGVMPLEVEDASKGLFKSPSMTEDEYQMWSDGFIPLPAPESYYEFQLGDTRTAYLILDSEMEWLQARFDRVFFEGRWVWLVDGIWQSIRKGSFQKGTGQLDVEIRGGETARELRAFAPEEYQATMNTGIMTLWCSLLINSKTTERTRGQPDKQSYTEQRKGLQRAYTHTIVNIVPKQFRVDGNGKPHSSPRLHWRRSHLRHFDHQTPGSKWCGTAVHNGVQGCFVTVIPRFLVGRADLGEVSHEYRVG